MNRRPISGAVLAAANALLSLFPLSMLALRVVALMSTTAVLELDQRYGAFFEGALLVAASVPFGIWVLGFAALLTCALGAWGGGQMGRAAVALSPVFDLIAAVGSTLAYLTDLKDLSALKALVSPTVLAIVWSVVVLRVVWAGLVLRSDFYPKAQ